MPIHPQAQQYLQRQATLGARPITELTPAEAREQADRMRLQQPLQPVARVEDHAVPAPAGDVPVRLYAPRTDEPLPVLVFLHGGGLVVGSVPSSDGTCRELANAADCAVVSVEYRLAPESRFPAPVEDSYAALRWVAEHAERLGLDPRRLAVGGISAGGNLAAAVALMARDRGGPPLAFQLLVVPVTDRNFETTSYAENATGYGLTRDGMAWYWEQ
jgi:acetyl esterase